MTEKTASAVDKVQAEMVAEIVTEKTASAVDKVQTEMVAEIVAGIDAFKKSNTYKSLDGRIVKPVVTRQFVEKWAQDVCAEHAGQLAEAFVEDVMAAHAPKEQPA